MFHMKHHKINQKKIAKTDKRLSLKELFENSENWHLTQLKNFLRLLKIEFSQTFPKTETHCFP